MPLRMAFTALLAAVVAASSTSAEADSPAEPTSWRIRDVTVVPLDATGSLPHRDVVVRDGRIAAITPHDAADADAKPGDVDGRGRFLVPGFVDAHAHLTTEGIVRDARDPCIVGLDVGDDHALDRHVMLMLLRAGVTSVANLGASPHADEALLALRDAIARGRIDGPRLFVARRIDGPRAALVDDAGDMPVPASTRSAPITRTDAIEAVREAKRRGYDAVKPYQFLSREAYRAVVDEARRLALPTTGHLPELGCARCARPRDAFAHRLDAIAHAEELARYAAADDYAPHALERLAREVARRGIAVTPTLITQKTITGMYLDRSVAMLPPEWDALLDPLSRRDALAPRNRYLGEAFRAQPGADRFPAAYDAARVITRELWKRGVPLTVGTDAALPGLAFGLSVQQEMLELRAIGLAPIDVLRAASVHANALFAPGSNDGVVRVGARADLVLLDADPLADLHAITRIAGVSAAGRWRSTGMIDAALAGLAPSLDSIRSQLAACDARAPAR